MPGFAVMAGPVYIETCSVHRNVANGVDRNVQPLHGFTVVTPLVAHPASEKGNRVLHHLVCLFTHATCGRKVRPNLKEAALDKERYVFVRLLAVREWLYVKA